MNPVLYIKMQETERKFPRILPWSIGLGLLISSVATGHILEHYVRILVIAHDSGSRKNVVCELSIRSKVESRYHA